MSNSIDTLNRAIRAAIDDNTCAVMLPIGTARAIAAELDPQQSVLDFRSDDGLVLAAHESPDDDDGVTELAFDALQVALHLLSLRLNRPHLRVIAIDHSRPQTQAEG